MSRSGVSEENNKLITGNVCAVIVTYNRKELLQQGLHAVLAQTRPPDQILVVNNASTDGTAAMLAQYFPQVQTLHLPENLGGAGGYHHGMQWALEHGFDWMMVMDDDGQPAPACLQTLLAPADPHLQVRAPLVLSNADPTHMAFTLHLQNGAVTTRLQAAQVAANGLIRGQINPFNGILIHRAVVEQIGLPLKEFFLWGDEYEYFLRLRRADLAMATVVEAHFYHPPDRMQVHRVRLWFKEFPVNYANHPLKDYLILRNQAYILKTYRGWPGWLAHVLRSLVFYRRVVGVPAWPGVFKACLHGARADFSHHKQFLS